MKKLMLAAATAAVAGGVFAVPQVYQYKASVKHMYAKRINVRDFLGRTQNVYQKQVKSAPLKGWLVVDTDGATSATLIADRQANVPGSAEAAAAAAGTGPTLPTITLDHGRNRAFLVVQNPSATVPAGVNARTFRTAKVLPANLEVNFIDTNFRFDEVGAPIASSGLAEGYLYVGGEAVGPVRPKLDILNAGIAERALVAPAAATAGIAMIQDYVWTSCYLFGEYNGPDYDGRNVNPGWWQAIQTAIDAGFEAGVSLNALTGTWAGEYYFHDTWMNGSGFGKFVRDSQSGTCCGFSGSSTAARLSNLSGNLKGGLFLCTYEGLIHGAGAAWLNGVNTWEDQWFTPAAGGAIDAFGRTRPWTVAQYTDGTTGTDQDQIDLWQDGFAELNTTDIITGTWSIKSKVSNIPSAEVTLADVRALSGNAALATVTEASTGLLDLVQVLKGCALDLNSNTKFVITTGNPETVNRVAVAATRYDVPAITPWFAQYYGLANWQ